MNISDFIQLHKIFIDQSNYNITNTITQIYICQEDLENILMEWNSNLVKINYLNKYQIEYIFDTIYNIKVIEESRIENPILKDTSISSLLIPVDIWKELSNYISSKGNDKNVEIVNSDIAKLENHGFDKKSSFRNPIKLWIRKAK